MFEEVVKKIKDEKIPFVDFRFTDTKGKQHHLTVPSSNIDVDYLKEGKMFDGSSISGWKGIDKSDMILKPDLSTIVIDPFFEEKTLNVVCDVVEPNSLQNYERDPRSIAKKTEQYLLDTGIADKAYFGNEPEFFVFDSVRWDSGLGMGNAFYEVSSNEATWSSKLKMEEGNKGHRPRLKGGYLPLPPVDSLHNIRSDMCLAIEEMGVQTEVHHHEVATAGQCEIGTVFDTLVKKADQTQILKYCIHNVAEINGKTATFMPKPITADNGNGMHVHQSLAKNGVNLFAGGKYAQLSQEALYYIGGIIKHARALNAFTNPSTNSYKRLVPGFEAPELLAYSSCNRSASIRIPYVSSDKARRIEVRFPDPSANPYLAFSAMLLAGLDGIQNKIDPGEAFDSNLYELSRKDKKKIKTVSSILSEALDSLDEDREFLTRSGAFTNDMIDAYIDLLLEDVIAFRSSPNPIEFEMYYGV